MSFCVVASTKLCTRTWQDVENLFDPIFKLFEECHSYLKDKQTTQSKDINNEIDKLKKKEYKLKIVNCRKLLFSLLYNHQCLPNKVSRQSTHLKQLFEKRTNEIREYTGLLPNSIVYSYNLSILNKK